MDSIRGCSVAECTRKFRCRVLCKLHYERFLRHGTTNLVPSPSHPERARKASEAAAAKNLSESFADRLARQTTKTAAGCWEWIGHRYVNGYAAFNWKRKRHLGHRLVFEHLRGHIPEGLVLDHLCLNKACVNPDHLEPVTVAENNRRARLAASQVTS